MFVYDREEPIYTTQRARGDEDTIGNVATECRCSCSSCRQRFGTSGVAPRAFYRHPDGRFGLLVRASEPVSLRRMYRQNHYIYIYIYNIYRESMCVCVGECFFLYCNVYRIMRRGVAVGVIVSKTILLHP